MRNQTSAFIQAISRMGLLRNVALGGAVFLVGSIQAFAQPDGAALFTENCSACHQLTGKGVPGAFPALAGDPFVQGVPEPVVMRVLNGRGGMPSFRADLADPQIAAILTYVRSAWGNHGAPVTPALVSQVRGAPSADAAATPLQAH